MASVHPKVGRVVAIEVANDPALKKVADVVYDTARSVAAKHADSGEFERSIQMTRGGGRVHDWIVYTDDPAALSKEYGHTTPNGRFVPGIHAFGQALGEGKRHAS